MDEKLSKNSNSQSGMSLLEVMIALTVFAFFAVSFSSGIGYNVFTSGELRKDLKLVELAELKMNELVVNPPEFRDTLLEETKDIKTFDDYPEYQYAVTVKKFVIPDLSKLKGEEEGADDQSANQKEQLQKRIFKTVKENMAKLVWQVEVEVSNKESGRTHAISTWMFNHNVSVQLGGF